MTTSSDLTVREELEAAPVTLFRTDQPGEVVARATETANALAKVIRDQRLAVRIQGREHVRVEGWTLLGTMLGVFPVCVWSRKLEDGWEARVEARTLAGHIVGAAEAECLRSERTWATRDDYALRSMAQTRATSKALRQPLGFVMTLAGFAETPAEEMPHDGPIEDAAFTGPDGKEYEIVGSGVQQTGPDAQGFQAPTGSRGGGTITDAQRKMVWRLIKKIAAAGGITEDELKAEVLATYGIRSSNELLKAQASELIASLKTRAGEAD